MKILGIIVEYNPFHTGHLYHLQKAKEMVKPDLTIAIMSGNYVQRGEVAIIDKFKRSELAIKYGVDLVIELPFAYVCQSADYFCKGAIDLLYHIGITDLVFGSECGDIDTFKEIAYAIKNHPNEYDQYVKNAMKQGLRYPDACNQALSLLLNKSIQTPNDLLGLGYVKEVIENDYPITLHCIKRSNDYHDTTLTKIASATALRKALKEKQDVTVTYDIFDFVSGTKQSDKKDVSIDAAKNELVFELDVKSLAKAYDLKRTGVAVKLFKNGELLQQKTVLFDKEKKLNLPKAKLKTRIEIKEDRLDITVKSDAYARLVKIESTDSILPFSDNFFDILPNESKRVMIYKDSSMSLRKLAESITVYSLCDIKFSKDKIDTLLKQAKVFISPVNISNALYHGKIAKDVELCDD